MTAAYDSVHNFLEEGEVVRLNRNELEAKNILVTRLNQDGVRKGPPASLEFIDKINAPGGAEDLALRAGTAVERIELRIAKIVSEQNELHSRFTRAAIEYRSLTSIWSVLVGDEANASVSISDQLPNCKVVRKLPAARETVHPPPVVIKSGRKTHAGTRINIRKKPKVHTLLVEGEGNAPEVNVLGLKPVNKEDLYPSLYGNLGMGPSTMEQLIVGGETDYYT